MLLLAILTAFGIIKAGLGIYGGDKARIEDHPWDVILEVPGGYGHAGAIISDRLVVTAAICVYQQQIVKVRAGSSTLGQGGTEHSVNETILYPGFPTHYVFSTNIALVRVNEPFKLNSTFRAVKLFPQAHRIPYGTVAKVSGWGETEQPKFNRQLYSLDVSLVDPNSYGNLYCKQGLLCAKNFDKDMGKYVCRGDAGDPLVVDGEFLAGIMSDTLCSGTGPSGYTNVPYFRNWIDKYLGVTGLEVESNDVPL